MIPKPNDAAAQAQPTDPDPLSDAVVRQAFEQAPMMLSVVDAEMNLVAVSDFLLTATGKKREEVCGHNVFEVFPDDPNDPKSTGVRNLRRSLERVLHDGNEDWMAVQRYPIERPNGRGFERRYWSPLNAPICDRNGDVTHVLQVVQEVTAFVNSKEGAERLAVIAGTLETEPAGMEAEILQRSGDLKIVNRGLEDASSAKNEFLARMSHELRTPLTAIVGFGELLRFSGLDPEREQWAATILKASKHLVDLLNEVLDISRIEGGDVPLSLDAVPVDAAVSDALQLMGPLAKRQGIELTESGTSPDSCLYADAVRLKQVLVNLISNGIKYNGAGGQVEISVREHGENLAIDVSDTGFGLTNDQMKKVFDPFERLDAVMRGVEGTGLGLALSRNLVEAMGGSLTVDSEVGSGSTFTIELRRSEPIEAVGVTHANRKLLAVRSYADERTLLYIEDMVTNVSLIEGILQRRPSVTVMSAMLGHLGIDLAREYRPELIMLDLHLPDLDGEDVLKALASDAVTRSIPVLILSADATMGQYDELMKAGARDYLIKPIGVEQLLEIVDGYLEN